MQLPNNKKDALKTIEQYNNAILTCLKQKNISSLKETYGIRGELISEFFRRFSHIMNEVDKDFFDGIRDLDASIVKAMNEVKVESLKGLSSQKKIRKGISAYKGIVNKP